MDKLIYNIQEIFTDVLQKEGMDYYNIPEYQRGYKWNGTNVKALLNDIEKFQRETQGNPATFYCLQNITLVKNTRDNCFNVVDGQQRLTTLLILLSFLRYKTGNHPVAFENKLRYSIRTETHEFIKNSILPGNIWKDNIKPSRKDQYYMQEVARSIQEWFEKHPGTDESNFQETLFSHVKLIVNVVNDKEEKIFSNLNGGKINLDGADLLRAVLMTRAAKEKFLHPASTSEVREFRIRMGMELDNMNLWFKEAADYFIQFIPNKTAETARSNRFDYRILPINLLYLLYYEYRKEDGETADFSFFEYGKNSNDTREDDRWEMYIELQEMYATLQRWYNDKELYHYLGFLMFNFKARTTFRGIYLKWKELNSRNRFLKYIQYTIATQILSGYVTEQNTVPDYTGCLGRLKGHISDLRENWYNNDTELFQLLILMDILRILKSEAIKKLPVAYFTRKTGQKEGEDKEHIRSQTPRTDKGEMAQNKAAWEEFIRDSDFDDIRPAINGILVKYPLPDAKLTEEDLDSILNTLNAFGLNSIGNMTLLDLRINRSYGNADYSHKRTVIFQEYMNHRYVRPHTLAVFMKGDIAAGEAQKISLNQWQLRDIRQNAENIARNIEQNFSEWLTYKD